MALLRVDLLGTFEVVPRAILSGWDAERAAWTVEKLELNLREDLVEARANHYLAYIDRVRQHVADRDAGADPADLVPRIEGIRRMDHPMVWHEMRRSSARIPALAALFAAAPEALGW